MIILNIFLIPLLALVLLGIVFIMGTIGLVDPVDTTQSDQTNEAQSDEAFLASKLNNAHPPSPLATEELAITVLDMTTANDQMDYGFKSLNLHI